MKKAFHQDGVDWRKVVSLFHVEMMSEMWIVWMKNAEMCCVHSWSLPLILQEMISVLYLEIWIAVLYESLTETWIFHYLNFFPFS